LENTDQLKPVVTDDSRPITPHLTPPPCLPPSKTNLHSVSALIQSLS